MQRRPRLPALANFVYEYFAAWKADGTWESLSMAPSRHAKLRVAAAADLHPPTTAGGRQSGLLG